MAKRRTFIAESVAPEDFYHRDWEGHAAEEVVRLLGGKTCYRIVLNRSLLRTAINEASTQRYDVFHLSCHGDNEGIRLTDKSDISWKILAKYFQETGTPPKALVLSSCTGGDAGIARAFEGYKHRPSVIFGAEATRERDLLDFPGACISWSILYTELATESSNAGSTKAWGSATRERYTRTEGCLRRTHGSIRKSDVTQPINSPCSLALRKGRNRQHVIQIIWFMEKPRCQIKRYFVLESRFQTEFTTIFCTGLRAIGYQIEFFSDTGYWLHLGNCKRSRLQLAEAADRSDRVNECLGLLARH